MIHLKSLQLGSLPTIREFPFSLPVLQKLEELRFESAVTLLVGENGTGKSTLLEDWPVWLKWSWWAVKVPSAIR